MWIFWEIIGEAGESFFQQFVDGDADLLQISLHDVLVQSDKEQGFWVVGLSMFLDHFFEKFPHNFWMKVSFFDSVEQAVDNFDKIIIEVEGKCCLCDG